MSAPALFPAADSPAAFDRVRRDDDALREGVAAICGRLGLDPRAARRYPDGSLPVYALGDSVLKLYPPCYREEREREATALHVAEGRLPVPTPGVEAEGEIEGWGYLRMTRLRGTGLASVWPGIPADDRLRLAETVGEALAALHSLTDPRLAALDPEWDAFIGSQRAGCRERQAKLGLAAPWLDRIEPFLDSVPLDPPRTGCFLHTEVMREHLLAAPGPQGWRLTGLFDFEPAMTGAAEYDFASVGLFVSCADDAVFGRILQAYGHPRDAGASCRFLAYALLHRYSNLPWYLERVPPPPAATRLEDLAALWWGAA